MQILLDDGTVITPAYSIGELVGYRVAPEQIDQVLGIQVDASGGYAYLTAGQDAQVYEIELVPAIVTGEVGFKGQTDET